MDGKPDDTRLSARELILTLMDSTAAETLSAAYLVAAGALFDMDPGSIRVALARLVRDGSLTAVERGRYGLGSRGGRLHALVRNWWRAESGLKPWAGDWLAVLTGHLARANKTTVRGNERALRLLGFAEAAPGLWARPANLTRTLDDVRRDLLELGLDPQGICAGAAAFAPDDVIDAAALWDTKGLRRRYQENRQLLARSTDRLADLDDDTAARETLLVGRRVTRDILLDPLLPDELVDGTARRAMIDAMRDYDRIGKACWRDFFNRHAAAVDGPRQHPAA
jgi:phenylacetic acid degradation operon negative regulatory protein